MIYAYVEDTSAFRCVHLIERTSSFYSTQVSMLTGDHEQAANAISKGIGGFDDLHASLSPDDKLRIVSDWRGTDGQILMIGDGVNDAPALAAATVGCCMGSRSATAVQNADVVIMDENVNDVDWFLRKCKSAQRIAVQNLVVSLGLMFAVSLVATTGSIPLWMAVTAHEGSTLLVGINGLRLLSSRLS